MDFKQLSSNIDVPQLSSFNNHEEIKEREIQKNTHTARFSNSILLDLVRIISFVKPGFKKITKLPQFQI